MSQGRTLHLATEDRHLLSEHDDLDSQIGLVGPSQAEDPARSGGRRGRETRGPRTILAVTGGSGERPSSMCRMRYLAPTGSCEDPRVLLLPGADHW